MRFAVALFVIAVGAILTFGVTGSPDGVNIQVIGLILILVGLAGLAIGRWLFVTRRRTDVIYGPNGQTWLEPNSPPPGEPWEPVERRVPSPPPEYNPVLQVPGPPAEPLLPVPPTERVEHGVLDIEPGSEEFRQMGLQDD